MSIDINAHKLAELQSEGDVTMTKGFVLRMEEDLMSDVKEAAEKAGVSMNTWINDLLEDTLRGQRSFNYEQVFHVMVEEIRNREFPKDEFVLSDLDTFAQLSISTAEKGYLQPSTLRARVGKAFNLAVGQGQVPGVIRAKDKRGDLKFRFRAAVYRKETGK